MLSKKWMFYLCVLCIIINTVMFPISLFNGQERLAYFQLLCSLGCWVGYLNYKRVQGE